jgi:hypothetical protein
MTLAGKTTVEYRPADVIALAAKSYMRAGLDLITTRQSAR